jgi:hypothetical protein
VAFEDELRRLGDLVGFAGAQETLNRYVTETWAKTHAVTLAPKPAAHRTVRLLAPLREDLLAWKLRSGRPKDTALVFPGARGRVDEDDLRQLAQAGVRSRSGRRASRRGDAVCTPSQLRLAAAARGPVRGLRGTPDRNDARLILTTYGHLIDELDD